jgi:pilus assembly protein TadC
MLRAEKAGAAAAQKLLLPIFLFVFPAVLMMVIGPLVLGMIYGGKT